MFGIACIVSLSMFFSGYVGHVTITLMLTTACCLVVGLGLVLNLVSGTVVG